ncbi:MAG: S41 family peptidase [Bacteroidetes bacterium]|nr:S41 family peptidase [Bacteroidota bacterium]
MHIKVLLVSLAFSVYLQMHGQSYRDTGQLDFLSGDQISRDLDSLYSWILRYHPSPFVHCSEDELSSSYDQAKMTFAGGGSLFSEAQMIARICNTLKDSHTGLSLQDLSNRLGTIHGHLPIEIEAINNQLIIVKSLEDQSIIGEEVVLVEQTPARSILGSALPLVSQEGDAQIGRLRVAEKLWNDLAPFAVGSRPGDSVQVYLSNGVTILLPVHDNEQMEHLEEADLPGWGWEAIELDEKGNFAVKLTIGNFHPDQPQKFNRELRNFFRFVHTQDSNRFKGLILDLRNNSGGHIAAMADFLQFLIQEDTKIPFGVQVNVTDLAEEQLSGRRSFRRTGGKQYGSNLIAMNRTLCSFPRDSIAFIPFNAEIHPNRRFAFEGPTSLLLNGLSASASVTIASWFIRSNRGVTIGESPMGSISGTFGNPLKLILPESGLHVNIASARYFTQNPIQWEAKPILPDIPINQTVEDLKLGKDPVLEQAIIWHSTH